MKTMASIFFCLGFAVATRVLFADAGFRAFEQGVYGDQEIQSLVNKINRDRASGSIWNSDPLAADVSKFQEEVYRGGLQQAAPKDATPPYVFEFAFQNYSGEKITVLRFLPRVSEGVSASWSYNAITDDGVSDWLSSSNLSLDFRGTSDSKGFPKYKSVAVMAHNMNGQPVHDRSQYVTVPMGVSRCKGVLVCVEFSDGTKRFYDIKQTQAVIRIHKNKAELYTGIDAYGNPCYEDVPLY